MFPHPPAQNTAHSRRTATATIKSGRGQLAGFYVSNTNAGTLVLWDNTSAAGTQISGTITPSIVTFIYC